MLFANFVSLLDQLVHSPTTPMPIHTGALDQGQDWGVEYLPVGRSHRRIDDSSWFQDTFTGQAEHYAAMQQGLAAPSLERADVFVLVHWPHLLRQARFDPQANVFVAPLAWELLYVLLPMIEQFDWAFAEILKRFRMYLASSRITRLPEPWEHGQRDHADEALFNEHLLSLLANVEFRKALQASMTTTFRAVTAISHTRERAPCPSGQRHYGDAECPDCAGTRWSRNNVTVIRPALLGGAVFRRSDWRLEFPILWPEGVTNIWIKELRYLLSAMSSAEGVQRVRRRGFGEAVLVDFGKLVENAWRDNRDSPFRKIVDSAQTTDFSVYGRKARRLFAEGTDNKLLGRRHIPLPEIVAEAGWASTAAAETHYELLSLRCMLLKLARTKEQLNTLSKTWGRVAIARIPQRIEPDVIHENYTDENGVDVRVDVVRRSLPSGLPGITKRKRICYFKIPFPLNINALGKNALKGVAIRLKGETWWTSRGIARLSNMIDDNGVSIFKWGYHFAEWCAERDIMIDDEYFKRRIYDERYSERVSGYQAGERKHIGRFSDYEQELVRDFFSNRPPSPKRLSANEWATLLAALPGRTKNSVNRQLERMGKEIAMRDGWAAYCRSPFCTRRSYLRRTAWVREGMKT